MNHLTWRTAAVASFLALIFTAQVYAKDGISSKVALPVIPSRTVQLTDFGGAGDGLTLNTTAFENALASLAAKGGGKLIVPAGLWITGSIHLRSHIELHLERGAVIKFASDPALYPLVAVDMRGEKEVDSTSPISGNGLESVAITGDGIIDGSGDAWRPLKKGKLGDADWRALVKSGGLLNDRGDTWWPNREAMTGERLVTSLREKGSLDLAAYEPGHAFLRPRLLRLIDCKKVLLQDVTFENPPNWTMNPALCEDVSIINVQVRNLPTAQNSDALDLESCRHCVIRGCTFDDGDDGICLKSGKDAVGRRIGVPTEDVLVQDCTVYHAHGGFVIGSEMSGSVRNIRVDNCTFIGTDIGLRFKSTRGRGGVVEKIDVSNVRMLDIATDAINFNMYYGGRSPSDDSTDNTESAPPAVTEATPQFRDIHIRNVVCRGAQRAIVLEGLPEMPIRGITLRDVSISSRGGVFVTDADDIHFDHVQVQNQTGSQLTQVRVKDSVLDLQK